MTTTSPFSSAATIQQLRFELSAAFSAELASKAADNAALAAKISRLEGDVALLRSQHAELKSRLSKLESSCPNPQGRVGISEEGEPIVAESDDACKSKPKPFDLNEKAAPFSGGGVVVVEISDGEDADDEDEEGKETVRPVPTPSRKRFLRVVASDSEDDDDDVKPLRSRFSRVVASDSDDDDDKPISFMLKKARVQNVTDDDKPISFMLKKARVQNVADEVEDEEKKKNVANVVEDPEASRRRYRKSGEETSLHKDSGTKSRPKRKTATCRQLDYSDTEEEDGVGEESESEGESLGGFIVHDDDSDGPAEEDGKSLDSEEEDEQEVKEEEDSDVDYDSVMVAIRREKKSDKWEYEADMLSAFSSHPELCLLAVCALYRQQTSEEQSVKATIEHNKRGFNQLDATRYMSGGLFGL